MTNISNIDYISYNDMPQSITNASGTKTYRYNAQGMRTVKTNSPSDVQYYIDDIVLNTNGEVLSYQTAEGYATTDNASVPGEVILSYFYNIKDWLGTNRVVLDAAGQVVNASDHYPYGLQMPGRNITSDPEGARYQFTGHEFDGETSYEYHGARYYNRELGKYMSVDPLAQQFLGWSSYNYTMGNPIMLIDPDGRSPQDNFLIKLDGSIEQQKTDSKFDNFYLENGEGNADMVAQLEKNESGLLALPNEFSFGDIGFQYTGSKNENYISGAAFAGLIGALNDAKVSDLSLNHWSNADGSSPSPSSSHKDGTVGDLRPLRIDQTGGKVLVTDDQFDKKRNASLISGARKYGWNSVLSERDNSGYITPGTTHYDKTARHNNHFHLQRFNPNISTVSTLSLPVGPVLNLQEIVVKPSN